MIKKISIFGAGGFGKEVYFLLNECGVSGLVDCFIEDDEYWEERNVLNIPVKPLSYFDYRDSYMVIAVGDSKARSEIVKRLPSETYYYNIVSPDAIISNYVDIGEGCIICSGSIITTDIKIGKHSHLNLNTTIGHDCVIGDFFTTAPAVNISGNNTIGNNVYIGTNACTREKITITDDVTIGMGSVVVKNIKEKGIYIGNPAKLI